MPFEPSILLENSPLSIVICDRNERIIWCNSLFLKQTSLEEEKVVGNLYSSLPIEAIDKDGQVVQLFSSENNIEARFQYWQGAISLETGETAHYFIKERDSQKESKNLESKLRGLKLPKRASWVEFLDYEVSRSRRYDNPLSIIKLHILISANPQNVEPDLVQQKVKDSLMDELRWADMIGHTDQGSYLMILPETPHNTVQALQDKLEKSIHQQLSRMGKDFIYQLVFGDASWRKNDDSKRLLERARTNLVNQLETLLKQAET
jgi:hypothetical protein